MERNCFVICPIGVLNSNNRKHSDLLLNNIIIEAFKAVDSDWRVRRADQDPDPGLIGDRVLGDLLSADLVVADLTDLNPNVFYELGIRHATQLPTIHMAEKQTMLPFDTAQQRTIFFDLTDWDSVTSSRSNLVASIRSVDDPNFKFTNPMTHANLSAAIRSRGDSSEMLALDIQDRMATLERIATTTLLQLVPPGYEIPGKVSTDVLFGYIDSAMELHRHRVSDDLIVKAISKIRLPDGRAVHVSIIRNTIRVTCDGVGSVSTGWPA